MNILGISDVTGNHSHSCIGILQEGQLTFALSQERVSRVKNDSRFPTQAIETALDYTRLTFNDIDHFACAYPPANYYGSLLHDNPWDVPRAFIGVIRRKPFTLFRYLLPNIRKGLFDPKSSNGLFDLGVPEKEFGFYDHHLSHVYAGYLSSGFDQALAISYGGFAPHRDGQNVAGAIYLCQGDEITFIDDIPMPATGCYYSGVSVALGFQYMAQEGKTMGLAKTVDPGLCYDDIKQLTTQFQNGHWQKYPNWVDYIMSPRRDVFLNTQSGRQLLQLINRFGAAAVAAAAQQVWKVNIVALVQHYLERFKVTNLVLSGGTFLNVQINRTLAELPGVKQIFAHPHTGDGSTTIGAMLLAHQRITGETARLDLSDMGLGLDYDDDSIEKIIHSFSNQVEFTKRKNPAKYAAEQLAAGKIIGWFQGREEYGQRSLGHRCLLGDPRNEHMKKKMTVEVKGRDEWIPIAPSVLAEHGHDYFNNFINSPFMTRVYRVRSTKKAAIPGALHSDGTARAQAVDKNFYAPFRHLIEHFFKLTNTPMLLNTSLNRHGEPIVHRPEEAIRLLLDTSMDGLVIGSFSLQKKSQHSKNSK